MAYADRSYLSAGEVASFLGISVRTVHGLAKANTLKSYKSAGGQYRFDIVDVKKIQLQQRAANTANIAAGADEIDNAESVFTIGDTTQKLYLGDARDMRRIGDGAVHLAVTSPPYFNAKMYSESIRGDLGNIHNLDEWLAEIKKAWGEVLRALAPGRKFFVNIMNLPIKYNNTFRSINLVGRTVDLCEELGFIFKRDIVWHKTNGARAHFGTYPYPGGILLNNMHEFILEFEKPAAAGKSKYAHLDDDARERSKLDKEFWLSLKNSDVWLMKPEKSGDNRHHVAPFPLTLPQRLIKAYSFVGEVVLDPFCGSGTTLRAAAGEGRDGVGYELNPAFIAHAGQQLKTIGRELL